MPESMQKKREIELCQTIQWLPADTETPISLYLKKAGNGDAILLESAEVDGRWGRYSILACDMLLYISCLQGKMQLDIRDDRLKSLARFHNFPFMEGLRKLLDAIEIFSDADQCHLPPITRAFYGYLGFGMVSVFNPHLEKKIPLNEAECQLALPGTVLVFDHLYNRLCQLSILEENKAAVISAQSFSDENTDPPVSSITASPDANGYQEFVRQIVKLLGQGEAIQVVPSVRFSMPYAGNPFTLYRRLRRLNASPYLFYMKFPGIALFGSSPEVMVRCTENNLQLSPIAGTRKRGQTDAEDQELAEDLLADPKERAEHVMLVDLGRNDLGSIAVPGSVKVDKYMEVERFSHVMHLTSKITAKLSPKDDNGRPLDALDVLAATFPAGTVSGAPKMRAMEIIRSLEPQSRGPYAGCIGWIGLDKDSVNLDMGITIRSMWVKDGILNWQAGGGIVHDSSPEAEWQEVCNKSAAMRLALMPEDKNYVPCNR